MPWRNGEEPRRAGRPIGFAAALLLHVAVVWLLVAGLARKAAEPPLTIVDVKIVAGAPDKPAQPASAPEKPAPPPPQAPTPPVASRRPAEVKKAPVPPPRAPEKASGASLPASAPSSQPSSAPAAAPSSEPESGGSSGSAAAGVAPTSPQLDPGRPNARPPYPEASRHLREEGTVLLLLHITTSGAVDEARVEKSSGFGRLDRAAQNEATKSWHFLPATRDGVPVATWHPYAVKFDLNDE